MVRVVRQYPLVVFFILAFAFTWANWVPRALVSRGLLNTTVPEALGLLAGYGPALAAVIVTALVGGGAGLRDLGRRLVRWRVGVQWWAVALLLPAAMALAALGLHVFFGGKTPDAANPPALLFGEPGDPLWLQVALLFLIFTLGFDGLGEEVGWRGFALPRLLRRYPMLAASLVLGVLWWLWHLPFAMTLGSAMSGLPFIAYLPGILATSVLQTWLFTHTRGSLLLAILFHAANNTTFNALPALVPAVKDIGVWGTVVPAAAALVVVVLGGPVRWGRAAPGTVPVQEQA